MLNYFFEEEKMCTFYQINDVQRLILVYTPVLTMLASTWSIIEGDFILFEFLLLRNLPSAPRNRNISFYAPKRAHKSENSISLKSAPEKSTK